LTDTKEGADNVVANIKAKVTAIVEKVVKESTTLVDKCKSIDPATAKKVAAGVLGAWGVVAGGGWLAGNVAGAGKETVVAATATKRK